MGLFEMRQYPFRVLPHSYAFAYGTFKRMRFLTLIRGFFQFFQRHIRNRLLIQLSNLLNIEGVSASAKYPHHQLGIGLISRCGIPLKMASF